MKILIVGLFFPHPKVTHAGGIHLLNYIKALSTRGHEISLLSQITDSERLYLDSMDAYCAIVTTVPAISTFRQRVMKLPYILKYPKPWVEAFSPIMRRKLIELQDSNIYDIVHFEHLWTAQYLDLVSGPKTTLDEVDVDSLVFFRKYRKEKIPLKRMYFLWSWWRTLQLEVKFCNKFDLVFTKSDKDKCYLKSLVPDANILVINPWFEGLVNPQSEGDIMEGYSLLFVGNMGRDTNIEAVQYFCTSIFPKIANKVPKAKLYIVGDDPHPMVKKLANERVIVTGYVDDLLSYYQRCKVFIAPMLVGGGIINKILNALSVGRAVVCTSIANEGIGAIPNRDLFVADNPDDYAKLTIKLLNDDNEWQRISSNGKKFVFEKYNWHDSVNKLESAYIDILNT
jgi:polysaccharide biosynthesis protein PslH